MNETRASCKDCQNRTPERFCKWCQAFLQPGLVDVDCEGYVSNNTRPKNPQKVVAQKDSKDPSIACLKAQQPDKKLIQKALAIKELKGSVVWQKVRCCKKNCRCSHGAEHGPYAYLRYFQDGKGRKKYLGKGLPVLVSKTRKELEDLLGAC